MSLRCHRFEDREMTSPDPYAILGVPKDADTAAVRKAYRKAAKRAHPDAGGDEKSFALIKLAHDVLTDAQRRAKYDATGSIDPKEPDNALSDVLNIVMASLDAAIRVCEAEGTDPVHRDLVALMKRQIDKGNDERAQKREVLKQAKRKLEKLQSRFSTKKSAVNFLDNMISQGLANIEPQLQMLERFDIAAKAAKEMLADYEFRSDKAPPLNPYEEKMRRFDPILGGMTW